MEEIGSYLCTETHGDYSRASVYKCKYTYFENGDEYYEIYNNKGRCNYAKVGRSICNLNYFKQIQGHIKLKKIKEIRKIRCLLLRIIIKLFKENKSTEGLKDTEETLWTYALNGYSEKQVCLINEKIFKPIEEIKDCDKSLFGMHQDKLHYILSNLEELPNLSKEADINIEERLYKYIKIVDGIYKHIATWEEQAKNESKKISKIKIDNYIKEQDDLLGKWQTNLNEIWGE